MRFLICVSLFLILGCKTQGNSYQPIDWSKPIPKIPILDSEIKHQEEVKPESFEQKLLDLHNNERTKKGRDAFFLDSTLCEYARNHASWMSEKNTLKHSNIKVLMKQYYTVGENIAFNQKTEQEVIKAWMNSSGHRANIMNRSFAKIGFGKSYNKKGQPYWCTVFAGSN